MKFRIKTFGVLMAVLLLPLSAEAAEKPEMHFDNRPWKIGFQGQEGNQKLIEFVVDGETVENWTELVTIQMFVGMTAPVDRWLAGFKEQMEKDVKPTKWNAIRSSESDVLFEWEIKGHPAIPDQYEIDRLIQGKEGFYFFHYANKNTNISAADRENWIRLMGDIRILTE